MGFFAVGALNESELGGNPRLASRSEEHLIM